MKKRKLLLGALILGVAALTACDNTNESTPTPTPEPTHEHTYATEWSKNETKHWHVSTCEHDLKKDEAEHTFDNGVETSTGKKYTCSVCGYEKIISYQVSETEWKEILNTTVNYSYEETITATFKEETNTSQIKVYLTENAVFADAVNDYKDIAVKENDKYYYYSFIYGRDGWTKQELTEEDYNSGRKVYAESLTYYLNEYSKFTYNTETKKYTLDTLDVSSIASNGSADVSAIFSNISIGFEDGKITSLTCTLTTSRPSSFYSSTAQIVYKNFGTTTIEIPNVD
mgnify:FL=1